MNSAAPNIEEKYTYGDYAEWPEDERWELINGVPYAMAGPSRTHQSVSKELEWRIETFLKNNKSKCKMFHAPFDVRLPLENEVDDKDISTVIQPDILVVCDDSKLDEKGVKGAPDLIMEILSPSTAGKDQIQKLNLYEKHGVREYWIVDPIYQIVRVYLLGENGEYSTTQRYERTNKLEIKILPGLTINLEDIFEETELV